VSVRWALLALAAAAACAPAPSRVDQALAPGDLVVVLAPEGLAEGSAPGEEPAGLVATVRVGADAIASLALPRGGAAEVLVFPAGSVIDARGEPVAAAELEARLDDAGCGCSVRAAGLPLRLTPGEACGVPTTLPARRIWAEGADPSPGPSAGSGTGPSAGPSTLDTQLASLRARLRLTRAGACGCPAPEPASADALVVCPLGEGAQRHEAELAVPTADGSVYGLSRGWITHVTPGGEAREVAVDPPWTDLVAATSNGPDQLVVLGHRARAESFVPDVRVVSGGRVTALGPADEDLSLLGVRAEPGLLWLHGRRAREVARRPVIVRCDVTRCVDITLPTDTRCPQHRDNSLVRGFVELDGGDHVGVTSFGGLLLVPAGEDAARCAPGSASLELGEASQSYPTLYTAAGAGRRLAVCTVDENATPPRLMVYTTSIARLDRAELPPIVWSLAAERSGGRARCGSPLVDPERPGHLAFVVRYGDREEVLELSASSTTVRSYPGLGALYAGAPPDLELTGGAGPWLAGRAPSGELWRLGRGQAERRLALRQLGEVGDPTIRAIEAVSSGFVVDVGAQAPLAVVVPRSPGCEGVTLTVPAEAARDRGLDVDAVGRLGTRVLRATHSRDVHVLEVYDASGARSRTVSLPRAVRHIRELIDDRWALLLDEAGVAAVTDGATLQTLPGTRVWRDMDAADQVGWLVGDGAIGRVTAGPGGQPVLEEDVLRGAGGAVLDGLRTLYGELQPEPTAVGAVCGGRALVGFARTFSGPPLLMWWLTPRADGLTLEPYDVIAPDGRRGPERRQRLTRVLRTTPSPLLLFGDAYGADLVYADGAPLGALPFGGLTASAVRGGDLLVGGPDLRLALIRVR
jgi:hypothetical protein